ncbi:hypothetical protein [Klebsiella quasipneumoniae]|uniref:hypothetical protein n=1 Tax=Klebsiella quasipneumoniae TaxID=1463165 RepID=UPI00202CDE1E|nr:hypothetical protein [Klebsiella quasipneumoniae]URR17055.1 hypothetical protein LT990_18540 [Klebsiella quasipneumoniae]WOK58744.1 hypothetical protein QQE19_13005 [Klebsiella quasipneumoniae]
MTITPQAVNELIASLESAGELSIREQKFLKLAKEFKQLAAENVEAKKIISECREYFIAGVMNRIRPTNEGYLHMICDTFADETPATDRIVAGIKADGVALVKSAFEMHIQSASCYQDEIVGMESALSIACQVESQLREVADK